MSQTFRYVIVATQGFIDAPSEAAAREYLTKSFVSMEKTTSRAVYLEMSANPGMRIDVIERPSRGKVKAVVDPGTLAEVPGLQVQPDDGTESD